MRFSNYLIIAFCTILTLNSCTSDTKNFSLECPKKTALGSKVSIQLKQLSSNVVVDSVQVYVSKKKYPVSNNAIVFNSSEVGVGHHQLTGLVFSEGKVLKVLNFLDVYADKGYKRLSYKLINTYPHDKKSFTQGLEFHNGILYETTGQVGESVLRKVDYKTGEVLKQLDLDGYFGEGMTIVNNSLYWLTWQGGKTNIYNPISFDKTGSFKYQENSIQGWGLTHDENGTLIKSDGSNKLFFLNSKGEELRMLQVASNTQFVDRINELEYVNGKIYANQWITTIPVRSTMVVINPESGAVESVLDLSDLRKNVQKDQELNQNEVLNGIAYNPETETFFVTGKRWGKLFEIKIVEKE